ncbi:MAG: hypothetical protein INF85_08480 [Roseomonas sp.]|nr:hypothetical protein [Roseomonas sp.]MCA3400891.1 hypothetical protein [Roseomonas sp.]
MLMSGEFQRRFLPLVVLLLPPFLLAGCATMSPDPPPAQPEVSRIYDPVAGFAADPPPNGEGQVQLADTGEVARLRLVRHYAAASGRECREVRVTRRSGEQMRLFCRAGTGWIEARPLLSQPMGRP